jgi:hypothetical protein
MLQLQTLEFGRHFCYGPEILERMIPDAGQITGAVGCDDLKIYAQPQTFDEEGFLIASQVGVWDLASGMEREWYDLADIDYLAGGLVLWDERTLLLVRDDDVHTFDLETGALRERGSLRELGVLGADGLAYDRARGELLVLDGRINRLFSVPTSALQLE